MASRRDEYVEVRPARLGLARISVVRGEGPRQGTACIDDYVRSLEPVTDYLTKWSGLVRSLRPYFQHMVVLVAIPHRLAIAIATCTSV